jgi:lipopolysaccharide transport system ATP-binding protein
MSSIRVESVSKRYTIRPSVGPAGSSTLREEVMRVLTAPLRRLAGEAAPAASEFWALRGVNLDVAQGERVGVIGRNGAGKSTLLKILSRVTRPTEGRVRFRGRMASLLEVGTGFHPELTGRENIFLAGTILGMKRDEIRRKFEDIVEFAEIGRFLETPVKRYSSGMYVRLAFSVAAHLDTEILLIDEVLAVGDLAFQKKCLGRMEAAAHQGRTVVFVSHNLNAVRALCSRGVYLVAGEVRHDGPVGEVLRQYSASLGAGLRLDGVNLRDRMNRCSGAVQFTEVVALGGSEGGAWQFVAGETLRFRCAIHVKQEVPSLGFSFLVRSGVGGDIIVVFRKVVSRDPLPAGVVRTLTVEIPQLPLRPNDYALYLWLGAADFGVPYDVLDENVGLPFLTVIPGRQDPELEGGGYVTLSGLVTVR